MKEHKENILLTGMMGSGKSTVGKLLAKKLKMPFWDTDEEIEKLKNKSIKEIFVSEGEGAFRRYERQVIGACLNKGPAVLSLGGGALCSKINLKRFGKRGTIIFLKAQIPTLLKRLKGDGSRPLLQGGDLEKRLQSLLDKRRPFYGAIRFSVKTDERRPSSIVKEIAQRLPWEESALWVNLGSRSYPLYFVQQAALYLPELLQSHLPSKKVLLITNRTVNTLYGAAYEESLSRAFEVDKIILPDGEQYKTLETVQKLYTRLSRLGADRQTTLIALGGGVLGDTVGFTAATYLRGISFVQIPTSLLAQVDSSIGGKTGVDLPEGKNLVGAFYQPKLVIMDESLLATLPKRELACGMAEVIKYGAIFDKKLFASLQERMEEFLKKPGQNMEDILRRCCELKAWVVEEDEEERLGLRSLLNFGHTLGHAIESLSGYQKYSHGEAVAMGMVYAAKLSTKRFGLAKNVVTQLKQLIQRAGLPVTFPDYSRKQYLKALKQDKKRLSNNINFVYLMKIGQAFVQKTPLEEVI